MHPMTAQSAFAALLGFLCVFAGNFLYGKSKSGRELTNFHRFLFSTGFAYIVMTFSELIRFFADYYIPGSSLQHYDLRPGEHLLFYHIFGHGKADEGQLMLLATDLRFFYMMLGTLLAGIILVWYYERKSKRLGDDKGLFAEYTLPKDGLKAHFRSVREAFRTEITVWEYVLWWALRAAMVWAIIRKYKEDPSDFAVVLLSVNLAVTFVIPIVRLVGYWKLFFGKLPLRLQSAIDLLVFAGSFTGHGLDLNHEFENYDKCLHMFTGAVCVLIGYLLVRFTRRGEQLSAGVCAAASFGFSCVVAIVWEIFEFFADFLMEDKRNQNWWFVLEDSPLFIRLFGWGARNPGQEGLLDTNMDMLGHTVFCVLAVVVLYAVLRAKEKQNEPKAKLEEAPVTVA